MLTLVILFVLVILGGIFNILSERESIGEYIDVLLLRGLGAVFFGAILVAILSISNLGGEKTIDTVEIQQVSDAEGISGYLTASTRGKHSEATYIYVTADGDSVEVDIDDAEITQSETGLAYVEFSAYEREGIVKFFFFCQPVMEDVKIYIP